jgi:DNA repair exonuclease SbcCD ATPase subunit
MSVLLRLATALWGLIVGAIADAVEWLRKPGSKIKVVCAVLAFGFMVAGLSAYEKEQRIQDLSAQVVKVRADWKADTARLQSDVEERDARLAEVAETLRAEAQKLEVLKAESAAALNGLAGKIEAAEKDATTWRERYQQRPDSCKAALELLDSACPALKGY